MATSVVTYQPAAGRAHVDLTSWAGDAGFATTPVATDQMEGPDTLTLNADGTVTGADGTYTMRHIIASSGQAEGISYQIGTPAVVPAGTITLGTPTIDQTTISLPFTYDDTDQTGFEYRVDGGAWTSTTSPVSLSGLTENTKYTIEVRAVNADGGGTPASTALTTDPIPSSATATVPFSPGAGYTVATLEAGFDDYAFQEWPANEPDVGWQLVTVTAEGYFDSQGNYWFDEGVEAVHDVWVVDLNGTVYYQTVDNTGLLTPLEGEITIGTVTVGRNSASIEFSYSAADAEGFEYRLDGGTWIDVVSPIALSGLTAETPYQVDLRAYNGTTQSVFKTVNFTTDAAVDTTPNAFSFTDQTGVEPESVDESNAITITGVDAGEDIAVTITGGQYAVSTDGGSSFGGWTSAGTNVQLNDQIKVRNTASSEFSTAANTTLTAGGVSDTFTRTTRAAVLPTLDTPIPDLDLGETDAVNLDLDDHFSGASSYTLTGIPTDSGLSFSGSVLSGNVNKDDIAASPFNLTATAFSADGSIQDVFEAVVVDDIVPVISINSLTTTDTTPVVTGSAGDATSLTLVVNSVTYNPTPSGGTWSQQLPELALDTYPMTLNGQDAAGNAAVEAQAVLTVVDEIVAAGNGLFRPLFRANKKSTFKNLFR